MRDRITVIGGGLAGLTAAIECAEGGASVMLYEAHQTLGGRARATSGPYVAHDGAHVFYADGPHYSWLKKRGFVAPLGWPTLRDFARLGFHRDGRIRRLPSAGMARAQAQPWLEAPVDVDFRTWAAGRWGEPTARHIANAIGVATYDADTGRFSAAFVWNLFHRVFGPRVPGVRWVRGGWQAVIDRMAVRAVELGVAIETGARVDVLPATPTIVATDLASARRLLADDSLAGESGNCVLLDIGVDERRADRSIVFDLDDGGFHESYTMQDDTIAPAGQSLFQLQMPLRAGESHADGHRRLAVFAESTVPNWRERAVFQRTAVANGRTGANDLPGVTWRDRPAIDRGDGVYLAGDMVAAPGMRGEISVNSALVAARSALASGRVRRASR